jgi:nitrous oxidase accessory protein NosD
MSELDLERAFRDWASMDADASEPDRLRLRVMAIPEDELARGRAGLRLPIGWLSRGAWAPAVTALALLVLLGSVIVAEVLVGPRDAVSDGVPGTTHLVAQDGSGGFATISDAVEAAVDGDVVLVGPGTYVESILVDKDVTLRGDGDRADIVIRSSSDRPDRWLPGGERSYAIRLQETDARVENLTLTGPASALIVEGGAPRIEGVVLIDVGVLNRGDDMDASRNAGLVLSAGSRAEIRDSVFRRSDVGVDGSTVAILENVLESSMIDLADRSGDAAGRPPSLISGNVIRDPSIAIWVDEGSAARIEGNEISGAETAGALIRWAGPGTVVEGNTIRDSKTAIMVSDSSVTISDNDVAGNLFGLNIAETGSQVIGNRISDNTIGVLISSSMGDAGTPLTLEGNTIEGNVRGVSIKAGTSLSLIANVICGNETNLDVVDGADVTYEDNDACEDTSTSDAASPDVP